jgi:uncharacterized repeat protein (TIGR03806 family)
MTRLLVAVFMATLVFSFSDEKKVERKEKLSDFGFFKGKLSDLKPVESLVPYSVNTPLFSNYAEKTRFIKVPEGQRVIYNDSVVFELPVGTVLIKNFYYFKDFRKPDKGMKIVETRLLVNNPSGWEAWPYTWNEEQTEAFYDPAGEVRQIGYIDKNGKKILTNYAIPNVNQCKGCHVSNGIMKPIGLTARQLNNGNTPANQLLRWALEGEHRILDHLPEMSQVPKLAVWDDPREGSINKRARAYLDANCGHCHSRSGPANTSGLYLDISEEDPAHLGVNKSPVAAGRGAGELQFDIVPGHPERSILSFRMKTVDPAIAMPEIGREQIDKEGVALIEEWIRTYSFKKEND